MTKKRSGFVEGTMGVTIIKLDEDDSRRHRSRCEHYDSKTKQCGLLHNRCIGSSQCDNYNEYYKGMDSLSSKSDLTWSVIKTSPDYTDRVEERDKIIISRQDENGVLIESKKFVIQPARVKYGLKHSCPINSACKGKRLNDLINFMGKKWKITEITKKVIKH